MKIIRMLFCPFLLLSSLLAQSPTYGSAGAIDPTYCRPPYAQSPTYGSVAQLYVATFGRAADGKGVKYWLYDSNLSLEDIARSFFEQPETSRLYDGRTTEEFISSVYRNLFGREADEEGMRYWREELETGRVDRSHFILALINGALADDAKLIEKKGRISELFAASTETLDEKRGVSAFASDIMDFFAESGEDSNKTVSLLREVLHELARSGAAYDEKIFESAKSAVMGGDMSGDRDIPDFPDYFFISATKAYDLAANSGIDMHSYGSNSGIYNSKNASQTQRWREVLGRSADESDFIIVVINDNWFGNRKEYVEDMQDVSKIDGYFRTMREEFIKLSEAKGVVLVNFPPDPLAYFAGDIRKNYDNDASNIPARVNETDTVKKEGFEDIPDNFAGFWQVIERLRNRYAPNVKLAYTLKTWGIGVDPSSPPDAESWKADDEEIVRKVEYLKSFGVDWDAIAFNFNPNKVSNDDTHRKIAGYYAAIARAMGRNALTGYRVRPYIWKTKIFPEHYLETDPSKWTLGADLSYEMRNIEELAKMGYAGINLGYGNEFVGSKKSWPKEWKEEGRELILPPTLECWLREYFDAKDYDCIEDAVIGRVPLQEME